MQTETETGEIVKDAAYWARVHVQGDRSPAIPLRDGVLRRNGPREVKVRGA